MTSVAQTSPRTALPGKFHDAAEWLHALGDIPLERIVMDPWPGTATEADLLRFVERDKRLVELVDGTLVQKPVGWIEAFIAGQLITAINVFIGSRKLGVVAGADATLRMKSGRIRLPDVPFTSVDALPGGKLPREPVPTMPATLAVEIVSQANKKEKMRQKIKEYFESGSRLVWLIYPQSKTVAFFDSSSVEPLKALGVDDDLDGGEVLKGFSMKIADLLDSDKF